MPYRNRLIAAFVLALAVSAPAASAQDAPSATDEQAAAELEQLRQNLDEYMEQSAQFDESAAQAAVEALPPDEYYLGRVVSLEKEETAVIGGVETHFRTYKVRLLDGQEKGKEVTIEDNDLDGAIRDAALKPGEKIALVKTTSVDGVASYHVADRYRLPALFWMALAFFVAAALVGGKRGVTAVLGLVFTVAVIAGWALPRIIAGSPAFPTLVAAAALIAVVSIFLAHGANARTTLAVAATLAALALTVGVELVFTSAAHLFGLGSEEAFYLLGAGIGNIDLKGLLLGGILLGALGVLDDVTTAQVAVVAELKSANASFGFRELYRRGSAVGREHIASLVNTLFLAYAGASLPLFLLFSTGKGAPLWFIANSEMIAEEIVRALVGSLCLVLAVPISTAIAARWYTTHVPVGGEGNAHHHH